MACWRVSVDQSSTPALVHSLYKPTVEVEELDVANGDFVIARVGSGRYLALVTDMYEDGAEVDVSLLMPRLPSKVFKWPSEMKSASVPKPHILCVISPQENNQNYYISAEDKQKLIAMKIIKK